MLKERWHAYLRRSESVLTLAMQWDGIFPETTPSEMIDGLLNGLERNRSIDLHSIHPPKNLLAHGTHLFLQLKAKCVILFGFNLLRKGLCEKKEKRRYEDPWWDCESAPRSEKDGKKTRRGQKFRGKYQICQCFILLTFIVVFNYFGFFSHRRQIVVLCRIQIIQITWNCVINLH